MTVSLPESNISEALCQQQLLVFSDDWGRHPSSCQHLIAQLLPKYHVDWVNTIGMRRPAINSATIRRGCEKLSDWTTRTTSGSAPDSAKNLNVIKPLMWPWFTRRWDRAINRRLLTRRLVHCIEAAQHPVVAVTTIPIVADVMKSLPVGRWVYYCVDNFGEWPGLDQQTMVAMEQDVVAQADVLIAVSDNLQQRLITMRRTAEVELLTHGVDLDHWQQPVAGNARLPIADVESPLIVFWGLIDRRLDIAFLQSLGQSLSSGTIALVGPNDNPDPDLDRIPRLKRIPAIPYEQLPQLAASTDALIMPYADLPVTRAMQPLKLLEYLATDRPVIVRDLPATREWSDCLDLAESADQFAEMVTTRLSNGLPEMQMQNRQRIKNESWQAKAAEFESLLTN